MADSRKVPQTPNLTIADVIIEGQHFESIHNYEAAIAHYLKALDVFNNPEAKAIISFNLAVIQQRLGNRETQKATLEYGLSVAPEGAAVKNYIRQALNLFNNARPTAAATAADVIMTLEAATATTAEDFFALGKEFLSQNQYTKACAAFIDATNARPALVFPYNIQNFYLMGETYECLNDFPKALAAYQAAHDLSAPGSGLAALTLYALGLVKSSSVTSLDSNPKLMTKAKNHLSDAMSLISTYFRHINAVNGNTSIMAVDHQSMIQALPEFLGIDDKSARNKGLAYYRLSIVLETYVYLNHLPRAIKALRQAILTLPALPLKAKLLQKYQDLNHYTLDIMTGRLDIEFDIAIAYSNRFRFGQALKMFSHIFSNAEKVFEKCQAFQVNDMIKEAAQDNAYNISYYLGEAAVFCGPANNALAQKSFAAALKYQSAADEKTRAENFIKFLQLSQKFPRNEHTLDIPQELMTKTKTTKKILLDAHNASISKAGSKTPVNFVVQHTNLFRPVAAHASNALPAPCTLTRNLR